MTRRIASLPLKEGDTVVLKTKDRETKGKVTRGSSRDALVQGPDGKIKLKLRSKDGGEQELTIEVDQRDEDGRELLLED